jgi:ketosteroid isomerase-like protein
VSAADAPVETALARYAQAVRDKYVDAFAALYAEDVHVFDMWGAWSLHGIEAWRGTADSWFGSLGDEHVVVT